MGRLLVEMSSCIGHGSSASLSYFSGRVSNAPGPEDSSASLGPLSYRCTPRRSGTFAESGSHQGGGGGGIGVELPCAPLRQGSGRVVHVSAIVHFLPGYSLTGVLIMI